jgi:hypothetical protein
VPLLVADRMVEPIAALLPIDDRLLAAHADLYGPDAPARSLALAQALASSPAWARLRGDAGLAVRPDVGLIGILGAVKPQDRALADALGWQVRGLLDRLQPVPHAEVDEACLDLADELRTRLHPAELSACRLVGIPRGGQIVAGLLAYALDLRPDQMLESHRATLTILADDCALSGIRLREHLREQDSEVIVALLHAHPDLCRRVEESEPAVRACVVARHLRDHAPQREDYAEWKRRWEERSPHEYWTGEPDYVCYPWNEPDALVWNGVTGRAEAGWRVAPPSWCIKNRAESRAGEPQICLAAGGPVTPADTAVWAEVGDAVILAALDHPEALVLRDTAASMWRALLASGDRRIASEAMAAAYGQSTGRIRADLDRFVDSLKARNLIRVA